jgi:hypothetical protein
VTKKPTTSFPTRPTRISTVFKCNPQNGLTRADCEARLRFCSSLGHPMKWTGIGCRNSANVDLKDGGCQCLKYCGYKCRSLCVSDTRCKWSAIFGCSNKVTGQSNINVC